MVKNDFIGLRVEVELKEKLKKVCNEKDLSLSECVRLIIASALSRL